MDKSNVKIDMTKTGRKEKKSQALIWPIIVITNNIYSWHIRKLRELCLTIKLRPTLDDKKYETRLLSICHKEKLSIQVSSIWELIKATKFDF